MTYYDHVENSLTAPITSLKECNKALKSSFVLVAAFSLFINLAMLAPSVYMLQVYDRVIGSSSLSTLALLTLILLLFMSASGGLEWARAALLRHVAQRLDAALNPQLFDVGHRQALYSNGGNAGTQPLQDLKGIRQFLSSSAIFAFVDAPWLPIYLVLMFIFHPWMGVFGVLSAISLTFLTVITEKVTRAKQKDSEKGFAEAGLALTQIFRNSEVIRAMGMLGNLRGQWLGKYESASEMQNGTTATSQGLSTLSKTFRTVLQSLILGLGAYLVIREEISPGMMIAGSILLGRSLAPIDILIGNWKQFTTVREQYDRLDKALGHDLLIETSTTLPVPTGQVRIENVSIAVPSNPHHILLKGISINCLPGSVVGIIGPSGSGKSTLARAILGIWPCAQGVVRLDGVDIFEWKREELGPYLGYLPQDVELFEGTVAENIGRFSGGKSEEIIAAAKTAGIHDLILRLEQGYETRLGPDGTNISGGQRQRIGLARAIYGRPKLLVLDEPNSNLDREGEAALIAAISALQKSGSTIFLITHNMALLSVTESTVVISDGALTMGGPTDKVLAKLKESEGAAGPVGNLAALPVQQQGRTS